MRMGKWSQALKKVKWGATTANIRQQQKQELVRQRIKFWAFWGFIIKCEVLGCSRHKSRSLESGIVHGLFPNDCDQQLLKSPTEPRGGLRLFERRESSNQAEIFQIWRARVPDRDNIFHSLSSIVRLWTIVQCRTRVTELIRECLDSPAGW